MPSVNPPKPMLVKKLMENRTFFKGAFGMTPVKYACMSSSDIFSFNVFKPNCSLNSWNKILIKILDADVVVSSESWMYAKHVHDMASVVNKCAKNLATFRNLFVSNRWMVLNCFMKTSSNKLAYSLEMKQNRCANKP
jgi:hypothetical protein